MKLILLLLILSPYPHSAIKDISLKCNFVNLKESGYSCLVTDLSIDTNVNVFNISGEHLDGYGNKDVTGLKFYNNTKLYYLPKNIANSLPNIENYEINDKTMRDMKRFDFGQFKKLKNLTVDSGSKRILYEDLLVDNKKLEYFHYKGTVYDSVHPKLVEQLKLLKEFSFSAGKVSEYWVSTGLRPIKEVWDSIAPYFSYYGTVYCIYRINLDSLYSCDVFNLLETKLNSDPNPETRVSVTFYGLHASGNKNDSNVQKVDVAQSKMDKFPIYFGEKFKNIKVMSVKGQVEKIGLFDMKNYLNLEELYLTRGEIKMITSDAFKFNQKLRIIDLSGNRLSQIGIGTFWLPPNLESLDIGSSLCLQFKGNNKNEIQTFVINRLLNSSCSYHDALYCQFKHMTLSFVGAVYTCVGNNSNFENQDEDVTFVDLITFSFGNHTDDGYSDKNVEALRIRNYPLTQLFQHDLNATFPNLKYLQIYNSNVKMILYEIIAPLKDLMVVDLSFNRIEIIYGGFFDDSHKLIYVNFEGNSLIFIPQNLFIYNINLEFADFSNSNCIDFIAYRKNEIDELKSLFINSCSNKNKN